MIVVVLSNNERLTTPLADHSWLAEATPEQQAHYELNADDVYWPALEDGLDIEWLRGRR